MKYGGEWALIADIEEIKGQQMAKNLAKEGYNIVTIGYNQETKDLTALIGEQYKVQTKVLEFDRNTLSSL